MISASRATEQEADEGALRSAADCGALDVGGALVDALAMVRAQQLPSGEIAAYERVAEDHLLIGRTLLPSTYAHEALCHLDPSCPLGSSRAIELVPPRHQSWFVAQVATARSQIRRFVAWQADADGTWRPHGRGTGTACDPGVTACAGAVLLADGPGRPARPDGGSGARFNGRPLHVHIVGQVEPVSPVQREAGAGDQWPRFARGARQPLIQAQVLRYLWLAGAEVESLAATLLGAMTNTPGESPCVDLLTIHAFARTWREAGLPSSERVARALIPQLLGHHNAGIGFAGPFSTALACTAMIDMGYAGSELRESIDSLCDSVIRADVLAAEPGPQDGYRSPGMVAAMAASSIARFFGGSPGGYE